MSTKNLLLALLFCFTLSACQPSEEVADSEEDKESEPVPVEVETVARGSIDAVYTGTATLEADGEAVVKAKVGGEIVALLVEEGDKVKEGQPLARIDRARLQLELARSKANLDKMQQDYRRNVELHSKGLLPSGTYEGMRFDLQALEAAYNLSKLELSYTTIRAPIAGVVSARNVKVGNDVNIGDSLFTVTDLDPLLANLYVPERDFNKLSTTQQVNLTLDALPQQYFGGVIARISPVVDSATGTFKVTVEVDDKTGALKPGMFGRVSVVYKNYPNAVLIPRGAVLENDGNASVFVVNDDKATQQKVTTGLLDGQNVQIIDGLNGGEIVVVVGQNGLKNEAPVKIIDLDAPAITKTAHEPKESEIKNN